MFTAATRHPRFTAGHLLSARSFQPRSMTTRTGASGTAKPPPQQQQQQQQREEQDRFVDYANQQLLPLYKRPSLVMVRGEGCHLFDMTGKRYLDFTAGIAVTSLGHGHPVITKAIREHLDSGLIHTSNLFHTRPAAELAEMLLDGCRAGDGEATAGGFAADKVFLCNSGTEANEAALKFARKYGMSTAAAAGAPPKYKILSFRNAFHGRTFGALSATPNPKYQLPFQPLISGFKYADFNDLESAARSMDEDTCAVIVEPIQGEGGITAATPEFLRGLRELCDDYGALLIFDEIQCGLGRTGSLFAHPASGVFPDILTAAKPLANGIPIGATILTAQVSSHIVAGDHGTTFGGGPFACTVAKAALSTINQPAFLAHVRDTGVHLRERLLSVQQQCPLIVADVRGRGLIQGIELRVDPGTSGFIDMARERGLLLVSAGKNTVRMVPPLIVTREQIDEAVEVVREVLVELERGIQFE